MVQQSLLLFKPDTKEYARKLNNLENPAKIEQAVEILDQWIKKQSHFLKKDYDKRYLENAIFTAKGSIEKAKEKLEKICILRTLLPKYFEFNDIREDYKNLYSTLCVGVPLPNLTPVHYRILPYKMYNNEDFIKMSFIDIYKFFLIIYEYLKLHDYCAGYIAVVDMREVNMVDVIAKMNPLDLKRIVTLLLDAQGMQLKGIMYVTPSKAIDTLLRIMRPILSPKIAGRIHVYKDMESLHKDVPKELLPLEFEGTGRSFVEIQEDWVQMLSSKENVEYLNDMRKAGVDENYKTMIKQNEKYAEMAGSFVSLDFD